MGYFFFFLNLSGSIECIEWDSPLVTISVDRTALRVTSLKLDCEKYPWVNSLRYSSFCTSLQNLSKIERLKKKMFQRNYQYYQNFVFPSHVLSVLLYLDMDFLIILTIHHCFTNCKIHLTTS